MVNSVLCAHGGVYRVMSTVVHLLWNIYHGRCTTVDMPYYRTVCTRVKRVTAVLERFACRKCEGDIGEEV